MNVKKLVDFISVSDKKVGLFLYNILIPLWVLIFYFASFARLLPKGVNEVFVTRSEKYAFWVVSAVSIIFVVFIMLKRFKISLPIDGGKVFSIRDFLILLLPLTPIVQFVLNNLEILSALEVVYIFIVFTVFTAVFVIFIPVLLRNIGSPRILMLLGLAFTFSIINMGTLSRQFAWHEFGVLKIQLAVFAGVFVLSWFFFYLDQLKLFYIIILIMFLTTGISQLFVNTQKPSKVDLPENDNALVKLVDSRIPVKTPDIYLLIYDAYVGNETMLSYGIDNQDQEALLEELGFKIYPHTYSVGFDSLQTMSRVLNASVQYYGNERKGVSGNGVVQNMLKEFGYKTYGIMYSTYFFRGVIPGYDYTFPDYNSSSKFLSANVLIKAIFTGEFRFDIEFNQMSREQFLETKANLFSTKPEQPIFVYSHSSKPGHSQNSGSCLSNEIDLYRERLQEANIEMTQDINTIIANDNNAIIIIAGDHGPYLTKNCHYLADFYDLSEIARLDVQDRYGTFLAIRWPDDDFETYDEIVVLQDLFPAIFAYIYQDPSILDARVPPETLGTFVINKVRVVDGILQGGANSGEPLFIDGKK